jgi:hypothetical protein
MAFECIKNDAMGWPMKRLLSLVKFMDVKTKRRQ